MGNVIKRGGTMKYLLLLALLGIISMVNAEDVYVDGYYRADDTYVEPYHRSSPDGDPYNNYSTGGVNPYSDGYSGGYHAPEYSRPSGSLLDDSSCVSPLLGEC